MVNKNEKSFVQCVERENVIQVVKSQDNALREMRRIKALLPARLRCFVAELAHNFYRVRVGYFKSYGEAIGVLNAINQRNSD